VLGAIAVLAALAARIVYPKLWDIRSRTRLPVDETGVVIGASAITLPREGGPAVLLLHGAGDSPGIVRGLGEHLSNAGYAVTAPLLSGHGRSIEAFRRVSAAEWQRDAREAYAALRAEHAWVAIVGLSVGGALAVKVAADHPDVPALVLLAPYMHSPRSLRWGAAFAPLLALAAPYLPSGGRRSIHDPDAARRARGYRMLTPAALQAIRSVVVDANEALGRVTSPTLIVQSREDNRIPSEAAQEVFDRLPAIDKRLEWIVGAGHVITVDYGHEKVFALCEAWLRGHLGPEAKAAKDR